MRLLLICAAWALGQTLTIGLPTGPADLVIPAALAIGAYALSGDLGRAVTDRGEGKYWRGRRIDDDRRGGGRWN